MTSISRWVFLAAAVAAGAAQAQPVYRIVGPDGRVTYSDKPPTAATVPSSMGALSTVAAGDPALPAELRSVAAKAPVTLYTNARCDSCGQARALLQQRGVPFSEKTVSSGAEVDALQKLTGDAVVPSVSIGGQHLRGYLDTDWSAALDAAGYPRSSQLPPNWRNPAPAPMIAAQRATPPAGSASAADEEIPPRPTAPPNPAGIRF